MGIKIPIETLVSDVRKKVVEEFSLNVHPSKITLMKGDTILNPMDTLIEANIQNRDQLSFIVQQ